MRHKIFLLYTLKAFIVFNMLQDNDFGILYNDGLRNNNKNFYLLRFIESLNGIYQTLEIKKVYCNIIIKNNYIFND